MKNESTIANANAIGNATANANGNATANATAIEHHALVDAGKDVRTIDRLVARTGDTSSCSFPPIRPHDLDLFFFIEF